MPQVFADGCSDVVVNHKINALLRMFILNKPSFSSFHKWSHQCNLKNSINIIFKILRIRIFRLYKINTHNEYNILAHMLAAIVICPIFSIYENLLNFKLKNNCVKQQKFYKFLLLNAANVDKIFVILSVELVY